MKTCLSSIPNTSQYLKNIMGEFSNKTNKSNSLSHIIQQKNNKGTSFKSPDTPNFQDNRPESLDQANLVDSIQNSQESPIQQKPNKTGIPDETKGKMESAFSTDFSDVRIHQGASEATEMGALAYTQGNDIHFGQGQFNDSPSGQELLGHELTHVVQQRAGKVKATGQVGNVPLNDSPTLENEADRMGSMAAKGRSVANSNTVQAKMDTNGVAQMKPLTITNFNSDLDLGMFSMKGKTLKSIKAQVAHFEKNKAKIDKAQIDLGKPLNPTKKSALEAQRDEFLAEGYITLENLRAQIEIYQERHKEDSSREKRMAGMQSVLDMVAEERANLQGIKASVDVVTQSLEDSSVSNSKASDIKQLREARMRFISDNLGGDVGHMSVAATGKLESLKIGAISKVSEIFGVGIIDARKSEDAKQLRTMLKGLLKDKIKEGAESKGSGDQQADAVAQTDKLYSSNKSAIDDISKTEAGKIIQQEIDGSKSSLFDAAKQAMIAAPFSMKNENLMGQAHSAISTKFKSDVMPSALQKAQTVVKATIGTPSLAIGDEHRGMADSLKSQVEEKGKEVGTGEIDQRIDQQSDIESTVTDDFVNGIITSIIKKSLKADLAYQLGESRRFLMKNNSSKEFRNQLKSAARDKANAKIDDGVSGLQKADGSAESDTRKGFVGMMAKVDAYDGVKQYVDKASLEKADSIIDDAVIAKSTQAKVKRASEQSLYSYLRSAGDSPDPEQKIAHASWGGHKVASESYSEVKEEARSKTDKIINTGDGGGTAERESIKSDVVDKVDSDSEGVVSGAIQKAIEADNIGKAFKFLGSMIDMSVPNPGSKAKVDLQAKIPFPLGGVEGYVTFQYVGESERESKSVKSRAELSLGFGVSAAKVLDISAQFLVFAEAQAQSTDKLMSLVSYAMYRKFSGEARNGKVAASIWGMGGKSGMSKEDEAETWSKMVEEDALTGAGNEDNYADIGIGGKAKAVVNAGIGKAEGEIKNTTFTRYKQKDGDASQITDHGMNQFEVGGKLEFGEESMSGEAGASFLWAPWLPDNKFQGFEVEGEFQFIAAFGKEFSDTVKILAKYIAASAAPVARFINFAKSKGEDDAVKRGAGSLLSAGVDSSFVLAEIGNGNKIAEDMIKSQGEGWKDQVMGSDNPLFEAKSSFGIGIKYGYMRPNVGAAFEHEFEISLLQARAFKVDAGWGMAEFETKQTLAKLNISGDGVEGDFLGIGNS